MDVFSFSRVEEQFSDCSNGQVITVVHSMRTLNLLARNLFLISRKLPRFISPLKGSLRMENFTSFWMSCQRA